MAYKDGAMGQCIEVSGKMINLKAKENWNMLTEMFMKVNGKMIRLTDSVYISILMDPNMKDFGNRISNVVRE